MSISYSAVVVCGFKVKIEPVKETQTRYYEKTGKPYTVALETHRIATIDGVEIGKTKGIYDDDADDADDDDDDDDDDDWDDDAFCSGETLDGLEFGESGYERGQKWLGCILAETGESKSYFREMSVEVPEAVKRFAEKYGLCPKFFLSMSCG